MSADSSSTESAGAAEARPRRRRHSREETEGVLLDVAMEQLRENGVLAGISLREVAKAAGVNHGQIYQYFGDRRALLRSAIQRMLKRSRLGTDFWDRAFAARRVAAWDWAMQRTDVFKLASLLHVDGDPEVTLFPRIAGTRQTWQADVESGGVGAAVDLEAVHAVTGAAYMGYSIFREVMARELDVDLEELDARARAVFERMVGEFVAATLEEVP